MFYIIGILALLAMGTGLGWEVKSKFADSEIATIRADVQKEKDAIAHDAQVQRDRADEIAGRFEGKLAKLKIVNTTINSEVRRETEKLVYGDPNCDVPVSGVVLINNSVREANRASGHLPSEVPPAAGTAAGPGVAGRVVQP